MRGLLDDAYELVVKLRDTLAETVGAAIDEGFAIRVEENVRDLFDVADDLANRIDRQRTNLRGT